MNAKSLHSSIDIPTLVAISVVAYALVIIGHEVIGHGGACLLVGGELRAVTSTDLYCKFTNVVEWKYKFMVAGGPLANLFSMIVSLALIYKRKFNLHTAYFLWVFLNLNLFLASSYLIGSPLLGFGDWNSLVSDLPLSIVWRIILSLIGIRFSFWGIKISINALMFRFRWAENNSDNWIKLLSRVPPFTVGIVAIIMGFVSPLDIKWSMPLAVLSFVALLWMFNLHAWELPSITENHLPEISLKHNSFWLAIGAIAFIFLISMLAPGIGSFEGYN
jgi:hypothetical protein